MIYGVKGLFVGYRKNSITHLVDRLCQLGLESVEFKFIRFLIIHTYLFNYIARVQQRLLSLLKDGDSLVAHSFGCLIVISLLNYLSDIKSPLKLKNIYLISPAVDDDIKISDESFNKMFVFYNPDDILVKMSAYLPLNPMGDVGQEGYQFKDGKITNIKINNVSDKDAHEEFFEEPNLTQYSNFIKEEESKWPLT